MNRGRLIVGTALSVLAVSLVAASTSAQGDVLYGLRGGDSALVRIDTTTRVATVVGPTGFSSVGGLAFGNDLTLYGIDTIRDTLIKIDIKTGAGQAVGAVGVGVTFSTGLGNDPVSDLLYGTSQQGVGFSSFLVTYSKSTGQASPVGDTRTSAIVGLDFDASGQLWGIDGGREELVKIDKTSAATTTIGPGGLTAYSGIGCFDIGPSGTFWAINLAGGAYQLVRINSTTGAPTLAGALTGITVSGAMTGLASFSAASLVGSGSPRPGGTVNLALTATSDAGLPYQLGSSLGTGPIPIDTRTLALSPDDLLRVSVNDYWPWIFAGYRGVMDVNGQAHAAIHLPNIPALIGVRLHTAFLTIDPQAPSGIRSISTTFSFSITK